MLLVGGLLGALSWACAHPLQSICLPIYILANVLQGELMQAVLFATWGCCLHTCRALVGVLLLLMQWGDDSVGS